MTKPFIDLSFSSVMDLYRSKCGAESRGDTAALANLEEQYPELFSKDFQEFIEAAKITAVFLDNKYGEDFSAMFEPKQMMYGRKLN